MSIWKMLQLTARNAACMYYCYMLDYKINKHIG